MNVSHRGIDDTEVSGYSNRIALIYILLVFAWIMSLVVRWPITGYDTDMWYHLDVGRYIIQNGHLPTETYFSYIQPPRDIVDYAWVFDILVHKTYEFSGYIGLIFLRTLIITITLLVTGALLWKKLRTEGHALLFVVSFSLVMFIILPRFFMVRPHIFSFMFISIFLYAMELRPRWLLYSLPLFAVLWMNVHGIYFPIMMFIIIAYLSEFGLSHIRSREKFTHADVPFLLACILSLAAVYATPHGIKLIQIPSYPSELLGQFIKEMSPINLMDITTFRLTGLIPASQTAYNILLYFSIAIISASIYRRKAGLSQILLLVFAIYLPFKGLRFLSTSILLLIPALTSNIPRMEFSNQAKYFSRAVVFIMSIVLIPIPFMYFNKNIDINDKYPLSNNELPIGVVKFLKKVDTGGRILNHPNNGGYIRWALYPKYKIYMDMEGPTFFTYDDFFEALQVFNNRLMLSNHIHKYDPDYLSVPWKISNHGSLIADFPEYKPVFFDDEEVLYVDSKQHPDISQKYSMGGFTPFLLISTSIKELTARYGASFLVDRMQRILDIYPVCGIAHQVLAKVYIETGDYESALPHVDTIIREFPNAISYLPIKADILKDTGNLSGAIKIYEQLIEMPNTDKARGKLYVKIGILYFELGEFQEAFENFTKGPSLYTTSSDFTHLYAYGMSAYKIGKYDIADVYLSNALKILPSNRVKEREKIRETIVELRR